MYANTRHRAPAALAALAIVALIACVLLFGLRVSAAPSAADALIVLGLDPPPPARPTPTPPPPRHVAARSPRGAPAPANLRNTATQIAAPVLPPLVMPPVIAAPVAGSGDAANAGAADRAGTGTGAGGNGDGTGGGGDDGYSAPEQLRGELRYADLPARLRDAGWSGEVGVKLYVDTRGAVSRCSAEASSGEPDVDATICGLIERRFRFRPSRDPQGRPVGAYVVSRYRWLFDRVTADRSAR